MDSEKLKICVHCGLCLEACPTYQILKNEADSPRGRILLMRGVNEGRIPMTETVRDHLDACLDCRACETACPAGVPYGELIEEGRTELYPKLPDFQKQEWLKKFLLTHLLPNSKLLALLGTLIRLYQKSGLQFIVRKSRVMKVFPRWMQQGDAMLSPLGSRRASSGMRPGSAGKSPRANVALLRGCIASIFFPQVESAAKQVLQAMNCSVEIPPNQTCCGALLVHGGFKDEAERLAAQNVRAFTAEQFDYIAVTAAGCGSTLKEYGQILSGSPQADPYGVPRRGAREFSSKVRDISEIIVELGVPDQLNSLPLRVAYQDACHLSHAQKIRNEPRKLLAKIPGLTLLEIPEGETCCGSAGIYNLTHPALANILLQKKIANILSVKPDVVAVGNPGCAMQIRTGLDQAGSTIPVVHPIELLARALP